MGGSSGGGGGGSSVGPSGSDIRFLRGQAEQIAGIGSQLQGMAGGAGVQALAGQGLTENELAQQNLINQAINAQYGAIGLGREQAQQNIQQNVRNEATARGLFSSAGAIGQEASQLAGLDTLEAQQKAMLEGQRYGQLGGLMAGAQQRQFQGLGLQQSLLGQAGGMFGNAANVRQGLSSQMMQADQFNYQTNLQAQQQRQQGMMKGLQGAVGLGMMFVPGMQGAGASMLGSSMR